MLKTRIGEIATKVGSGSTPKGGKNSYKGGKVALIRSQNVRDMYFDYNGLAYINNEQAQELDNVEVKSGDILFNITGDSIARCCIVPNDVLPARVNQHVAIIRTPSIDSHYLMYKLQFLKSYLLSISHGGSSRNAITKKGLENIEIKIPRDANNISRLLDALSDKVNNNNNIVKQLNSIAKTIYDYWFLQFEFPNEEGKPYKSSGGKMVWNEELQRDIPEGWGSEKLKDVIVENPKSKIKVGDVKNIGEVPFFTSGAEILSTNDSIVSGLNCYLNTGGNADVKYYYGDASYSTDTWCITARDDMKYILPFILDKIKPSMDKVFFQGTGLRHLQKNLLREYSLCIPDNDVLKKFEKIARDIFVQQHNLLAENRELESLKEFLLPLLMNGQVTVGE